MTGRSMFKFIMLLVAFVQLSACQSISNTRSAGATKEFEGKTYVWIPAGSFEVGSRLSPDEIQARFGFDYTEAVKDDAWGNQGPLTEIAIENGFWMAAHEVTVGDFRAFVEATEYETEAERDGWGYTFNEDGFSRVEGITWRAPGWAIDDHHPVVLISWRDAVAYAAWYDEVNDGSYRMPTEFEWEYSARAGTRTNFFWGDDIESANQYANLLDKYFGDDGYERTAPVGSFLPNPWGVYDIIGNVWEWTSSKYSETYDAAPAAGGSRVDRGGGWYSPPFNARVANRGAGDKGFRHANLGVRLMRTEDK